jgi:hypothetical protein
MTDTTDSANSGEAQSLLSKATHLWWRCEAAIEKIEGQIKAIMATPENAGTGRANETSHCTDDSVRGSESAHVNNNRISIRIDANALAIIALIVAVVAIVMVLSQPQIVEAKIQAGAARAEATARAADTNARVAVDEIERMRTALAAKNIIIPKGHD